MFYILFILLFPILFYLFYQPFIIIYFLFLCAYCFYCLTLSQIFALPKSIFFFYFSLYCLLHSLFFGVVFFSRPLPISLSLLFRFILGLVSQFILNFFPSYSLTLSVSSISYKSEVNFICF